MSTVVGNASGSTPAIQGFSNSATMAISGANTANGYGVYGASQSGVGVFGGTGGAVGATPSAGAGVWGESNQGFGVYGTSDSSDGVHGETTSSSGYGVSGVNNNAYPCVAIDGSSLNGHGVHGLNGESGSGAQPNYGCGVWGESNHGFGVYGASGSYYGLFGTSNTGDGVHGETTSSSAFGVSGLNNSAYPCVAIYGLSENGHGVHGVNQGGAGAPPSNGCGVWGESDQGIGVYGASASGSAAQFQGNVVTNGNHAVSGTMTVGVDVILTGGDCAERFDVSAAEGVDPGTIMVIGEDGALRPSDRAYDRRVAGVVSGAGGYRPGIVLDKRPDDEGRVTIALVGKVYCKADANAGPIRVGDLLTTSDTPGHAMSVADPLKALGAIIGKSLGALQSGLGLVPMLIALQ
jgi:hypothetical protein